MAISSEIQRFVNFDIPRIISNDPTLTESKFSFSGTPKEERSLLSKEEHSLLSKGLKTNQFLKSLNLFGVDLEGIKELANALKVNCSLSKFILIGDPTSSGNPFGNAGIEALSSALKVNVALTELNVWRCGLTDITELAEVLKVNHFLSKLYLDSNAFGSVGGKALAVSLKVNVTLTELSLNSCSLTKITDLAESLKVNRSLTKLDFGDNDIGYDWAGQNALFNALKVNVTLADLNICGCGLTEIYGLIEPLKVNRSLTKLNLRSNKLENRGGNQLGYALRENVTLAELEMLDCALTDIPVLAGSLTVNRSLTKLDLRWNTFVYRGMGALAVALKENSTLVELLIEGHIDNDEKHLKYIEEKTAYNKSQSNVKEKDSKTVVTVVATAVEQSAKDSKTATAASRLASPIIKATTTAATTTTVTTASTATGTSFLGRIVERVQALPVRQTISNIMSLTHANTYGRLMTLTGGGTFDRLQELPKQHDALSHQVQKLSEIDTVAIKALPEKHDALSQQVQRLAVLDTPVLELLRGRSEQLQRLFEEDTKTEFNKQEKDRINANPSLQIYYQFFVRLFNGTWMACQTINSRMVDNSEMYASDYIGQGVDQIGRCIPGIAMATGFFALAIQGWNYREKRQAVQRMALLFPDLDTAFKQLSQLARQATLAQEKEISSMPPPQGVIAKIKEGIKDLTAFILASDANTPLKRKAEEDCKKLLKAIKEGKLPSQPTLNDLLCVIMGMGYKYQSPVAAIASSTATILPEMFPNHLATVPIPTPTATPAASANVLEMAEQLRKLQAKDAERELELIKMKEEMAKLKSQLPPNEHVELGNDQVQLQLSKSKQSATAASANPVLNQKTMVLEAEIAVIIAKQNEHTDDIEANKAALAALSKKKDSCVIT